MKIQTKASLGIFLFGTVTLLCIAGIYQYQTRKTTLLENQQHLIPLGTELSQHTQTLLENKIQVAITLANSPVIVEAIRQSNKNYDPLSIKERTQKISSLDQQWRTSPSNAPFIQSYMSNPASVYLKTQQQVLPNVYGEIFITNRYGALIATTGRLSTLAHAHKYWWQGAYANGKGAIYIDDRGFDTSVNDVVLGIVIPVKVQNEIVGILKCNFLISGPLSNFINAFNQRHDEKSLLARSGGLIIAGTGQALSNTLPKEITHFMQIGGTHSAILDKPLNMLVATVPIAITLENDEYRFGGNSESLDHNKGNQGEAWYIVVTLDKNIALLTTNATSRVVLITGALLILLSMAVALLMGWRLAKPVHILTEGSRRIGEGKLDTRIHLNSKDEIAEVAESLNIMADQLSKTMASRDELTQEVEKRKEAEHRLTKMATTDALTGVYNRHFLCSRLNDEMGRAKRYKEPLSLIMLDADYFKKINDCYGHNVGDQVLRKMVKIARHELRSSDILCRWGGEEFMIILPHTTLEAAGQLGERLRAAVAKHEFNIPQCVTVSIGVTEFQPEDNSDSFIKRVDDALYMAKDAGRNRVITKSVVKPPSCPVPAVTN